MPIQSAKRRAQSDRPFPIVRCGGCGRRIFDGAMVGVLRCAHCNHDNKFVEKKHVEEYIQRVVNPES